MSSSEDQEQIPIPTDRPVKFKKKKLNKYILLCHKMIKYLSKTCKNVEFPCFM